MVKLTAIVIAVLLACVVTLGYQLRQSLQREGATEAAVTQQAKETLRALEARDRAVLASQAADRVNTRLARDNAAMARERASLARRLEDALTRQAEWADTPIPEEVRRALIP